MLRKFLCSSAPEIVGLLSELNEALMQLQKVEPLVCEVLFLKKFEKSI